MGLLLRIARSWVFIGFLLMVECHNYEALYFQLDR